jgi:hypothetical protein
LRPLIQQMLTLLLGFFTTSSCLHALPISPTPHPSEKGYLCEKEKDLFPVKDWQHILEALIKTDGEVDYRLLQRDPLQSDFQRILRQVKKPIPKRLKPCVELSYWLNAYHLFTIGHILKYPKLDSVATAVNDSPRYTFFKQAVHEVNGRLHSLNEIEHQKIRARFKEPRIHMALNCASKSCPQIYQHPFEASKLDAQLRHLTRVFINDKSKNTIDGKVLNLSKIFSWYDTDFVGSKPDLNGVRQVILKYADVPLGITAQDFHHTLLNAPIKYLPYDWSLNGDPPQ